MDGREAWDGTDIEQLLVYVRSMRPEYSPKRDVTQYFCVFKYQTQIPDYSTSAL